MLSFFSGLMDHTVNKLATRIFILEKDEPGLNWSRRIHRLLIQYRLEHLWTSNHIVKSHAVITVKGVVWGQSQAAVLSKLGSSDKA